MTTYYLGNIIRMFSKKRISTNSSLKIKQNIGKKPKYLFEKSEKTIFEQ